MELVAGYPYWLIRTGLPYQYPKLPGNKTCQALIIGGGVSGALTAFYCIRAGVECILVDRRTVGLGSTCASTSLLQYELDTPLHKLRKLVGDHNAVRSYQLCGHAVDTLVELMDQLGFTGYSKKQSLFFSTHRRQVKMLAAECAARKEAGFDVDLIGKGDLKTDYGLDAECAILSEKGATNNAYLFTHEILQFCLPKGLQVFDRTKIKGIARSGRKIISRTETGHSIISDFVINASGYEVVNFIGNRIVDLDCTYAVVSESSENEAALNERLMMWNTDDPYLYLSTTDDHRTIIGGRDEPFVNLKTMHQCIDRKSALLKKDFEKLFAASSLTLEFAWSGVFGKTKDSLPYIGSLPGEPRIFYALGFGGNGITFSLIAAEIISDLILGKRNSDASIFSFDR